MSVTITTFEQQVKAALAEFEKGLSSGQSEMVGQALSKLNQYSETAPSDTHPQLIHYLKKRSYQKAIQWLNGEDPER